MTGTRLYPSPDVRNLRDFGNWPTMNAQKVASGRLLRSGHWADAKSHGFDLLRQLGPETFIDLRRPAERGFQPNVFPDNMDIEVLASDGGDMSEPPHVRFLRENELTQNSVRAYMQSAYRRIPTERHHQDLFRQTILHLGQGKTVLIHCAAGKDRTGILAALILNLLGVDPDIVMEDYLLTNKAVDIDAVLPGITRQISKRLDQQIAPGVLYPMLGVEAGFLEEAYAVMGEPEAYAREQLNLTAGDLDRLRDSLTIAATS
ncbi:MAG: protein tyrosine phosphatase [Robiginitomaculum sp.]|nr:MAG: protein tyrosine phosphatase [Robiginitomaculum sp.]